MGKESDTTEASNTILSLSFGIHTTAITDTQRRICITPMQPANGKKLHKPFRIYHTS